MQRAVKGLLFLVVLGAMALAWYAGASLDLENRILTLANHPEVRTAFADPESGRSDAIVTLISFAVLTPLGAGLLALLVIFIIKAFETVLVSVRLPAWLSAPVIVAAIVFGVYETMQLWLANSVYAAGLVSRAYVVYAYGTVPMFLH